MPDHYNNLSPEIDEYQCLSFLAAAQHLGFSTAPAEPTFNAEYNGVNNPEIEAQLRKVLPDYAEFIIPVMWSASGFVGHNVPANTTEIDLVRLGRHVIYSVGLAEGQRAPSPSFLGRNDTNFIADAYFLKELRGVSLQSDGYFRQGFLAICRNGIAVIGVRTDWTPSLDSYTANNFRDPYDRYTMLSKQLPGESAAVFFDLLNYARYDEIEDIQRISLIRFDGLATLLRAYSPGSDKRVSKQMFKQKIVGRDNMGKIPALAQLDGYRESLDNTFVDAWCELAHGICPVSGTGLNEHGRPRKILFSKATGIVFTNAQNGARWNVESIFSDLDAGFEAMEHLKAGYTPATPAVEILNPTSSSSLAEEIAKLSALKDQGLLTEDEFTAAKQKLLG